MDAPVSLNNIIRGLKAVLAHNKNNNNSHNPWGTFNVPGTLCVLSLILSKTLKCKYHYLHFTDMGTEAQNEVTCSMPHIYYVGICKR